MAELLRGIWLEAQYQTDLTYGYHWTDRAQWWRLNFFTYAERRLF